MATSSESEGYEILVLKKSLQKKHGQIYSGRSMVFCKLPLWILKMYSNLNPENGRQI
jgi:hypothetical protein